MMIQTLRKLFTARQPAARGSRRSERGNVFFTLFGAVAVVGVIGAGTMAIMRGPLSTVVEVNRGETAKSQITINNRLLATSGTSGVGGACDDDETTEAVDPDGTPSPSPAGGGSIPGSVGGSLTDPWGTPYGYCAWNHGANTNTACGNIIEGAADPADAIFVFAVISAGPDRQFQTTCAAHPTYLNDNEGAGDDITIPMTFDGAIAAGGGLWVDAGGGTITTTDNIDVDGGATFGGNVDLSGTTSAQLRLGAASLLLPLDTTTGTTNGDCSGANQYIQRINRSVSPPALEICDGSNWNRASSIWNPVGNNARFTGGDAILDSGENLNWGGSANIQGTGTDVDITGATAVTGNFDVTGDVIITGSANSGTTAALNVRDSGTTSLIFVQHDGNVGIGATGVNDRLQVAGSVDVDTAYKISDSAVLRTAGDGSNILVGSGAGSSVTGTGNTIVGGSAAGTLAGGTGNIIIGNAADVSGAAAADELNIGGTIVGDLANDRVGIGYAPGDIATMNDTLEVNGNADIDGVLKTDEIAESSTGSGITISNNIVSDVNIVGGDLDVNDNAGTGGNISADDITSRGDVGTVTVTATGTIEANNYTVQGNQFVPATCASGKFNRWDGNSWECEDDSAGGSGSGGANVLDDLDDVVITSSDTGDCIQYNGTNWVDIPCSTIAAASNVFEVTGAAGSELARQIAANVPIATSDFLFGGTTLDNQAGTDDDARMFFDKDRSAFRAGLVDGTQWDHAGANLNRGLYSAAFGQDTTASGAGSFAFGSNVGAGISATNTGSFAGGVSTSAPIISSGSGSFAFGATGSGGISATGTGAIALGDAVNATAGNTVAIGRDLSVSSIGSLGLGNDITISNTYSMGVGLGSVPFGANPIVSGANSAAFFMGSHTGGLNMTASNTFGIFGGRMVIDPTVPATVLAPATGGAEATDGDLELHVVGDIGAGQYCDEAGDTCFQAGDVSGAGIWQPDGTNNYIEYDDTLGGVRIGRVTGQPAPETDWNLSVATSVVHTTNKVGINTATINNGTGGGGQDLNLDINGAAGADYYCDSAGLNCFQATDVSGSGSGVFEVTGAAGSELVRQVAASAPIATSDFVFGSTQLDDLAGTDDDARMFFDKSKGAFRAGTAIGDKWDDTNVGAGSFGFGQNNAVVGANSGSAGENNSVSGSNSFVFGNSLDVTGDVGFAFGYGAELTGRSSVVFALDEDEDGDQIVSGEESFVIFMGTNDGYDFDEDQKLALIGGEFQIDNAGSSPNKGCIRYNSPTTKLQFSHDCSIVTPVFDDFGAAEVAGNDTEIQFNDSDTLGADDGLTYAKSTNTLTVDGIINVTDRINIAGQAGNAPGFASLNDLSDVDTTGVSDDECLIYNAGAWGTGDCDVGSGSGVFEVTGAAGSEVVRQVAASAPIATADFVFGSSQLDNIAANTDDDARMFFDKSKGAFRAGTSADTVIWNDASVGTASIAMGNAPTASGIRSIALGHAPVASGMGAVSIGATSTAGGVASMALAYDSHANGTNSIAMGKEILVGTTVVGTGGAFSMGIGLGDNSNTGVATRPRVSGDNSFAIFSGDQVSVDVNSNNVAAFLGTSMIINPDTTSASPAVPLASGAPEAADGNLELHVVGDIGAVQYCDEAGDNCFDAADVGSGSGVFEVTGAAGSEVVRQVAASAPLATADFVFGSATLDDDGGGDATDDSRMFFDKSKGAFRAGTVETPAAGNWDEANVGSYSAAFGQNTISSGAGSFAAGVNASATGDNAFAMGLEASASANNAFAFGQEATASGAAAIAIGETANAGGDGSVALGIGSDASAGGAIAGPGATASGPNSVAFSPSSTASGNGSVSLGMDIIVSGTNSIGFSAGNVATFPTPDLPEVSGNNSVGIFMGDQETVDVNAANVMAVLGGSMIINPDTTSASPAVPLASGAPEAADGNLELHVVGDIGATQYCDTAGDNCFAASDVAGLGSPVFEVTGAAGSEVVRNNNTNAPIDTADFVFGSSQLADLNTGTTGDNRMFYDKSSGAFRAGSVSGTQWDTVGTASAAFGLNTTASGLYSAAFNTSTSALGIASTAFGGSTNAIGHGSFATGSNTNASGIGSYTFGMEVLAGDGTREEAPVFDGTEGHFSVAWGLQTGGHATDPKITGDRSMVLFFDGGAGDVNSGYDFDESDKFALIGGEFQIDDDSSSANKGCINYFSGKDSLQFSNDCSNYLQLSDLQNIFITLGSKVTANNSLAPRASSDFVFGSSFLEDVVGTDDDARMFFDKSKGAFRAGTVIGSQWNDANIGANSVAFGLNTSAAGPASMVFGSASATGNLGSAAGGVGSLTFGQIAGAGGFISAAGPGSVAYGFIGGASGGAIATLGDGSFAGGMTINNSQIITGATGDGAFAFGYNDVAARTTLASGLGSVALGREANSTGSQSIAMGNEVTAGTSYSMAIGLGNSSAASQGTNPQVSAINSFAVFMGDQAAVDVNVANTVAFLGGSMIINPDTTSASPAVPTAGIALDVIGSIEYTGTITDVSDRRLKDDIEPLKTRGSMLEKIDQVETVSFVMKDDEERRTEFGVIAQDIEPIFPELVRTAPDGMGTKSVNYVGLIAPVIQATQELHAENMALRVELENLKAELQSERADIQDTLKSLTKQVDLLNKAAGQNVGKAGFNYSWLMIVFAMFAMSGGFIVLIRRKV